MTKQPVSTGCSDEYNRRKKKLSKEIKSGSKSLKGRLTRLPQIDVPKQWKTIEGRITILAADIEQRTASRNE